MPDDGSVWDTGPQYPEIWPGPSGDPEPVDTTPESLSPVDLDAPTVPVVPVPSPERRAEPEPPWWKRRLFGLATWIWLLVLAAIVALLLLLLVLFTGGADDPELTTVTSPTVVPTPAPTTPTTPVTLPVATTAAPATAPATPAPTAPATAPPTVPVTAPPVTEPPATAAPTAPTTTVPAPTTTSAATLPPDGPVVTIIGSVGPCNFGSECLIAGFTIHNFDTQPNEFVCEFADGSRYTFRFDSQGVERACATGDPSGSITIEVAGVRSETFTRP